MNTGLKNDGYWSGDIQSQFFRLDQIQKPMRSQMSDQDIIAVADKFNEKYNIREKENLENAVVKLGGVIKKTDFWDSSFGEKGSIWILPDGKFTIWISNRGSPRINRFTIAHELGHYFIHFKNEPRKCKTKPMVAARYDSGDVERQANIFALNALIPKKTVCEFTKQDLKPVEIAKLLGVDTYLVNQQISKT